MFAAVRPDLPARYILTISCVDRPGIVGAVGTFFAAQRCNIVDSAQFGGHDNGRFFMRVLFESFDSNATGDVLRERFATISLSYAMDWALHEAAARPNTLLLVSKLDHCLNDLLYRSKLGALPMTPVAIVSNHPDAATLAQGYGVPFHHLPVTPDTKPAQEAELYSLVEHYDVELTVLARYMQVLSDDLTRKLAGRAINIHHGLLPSFKGAKPYHQAYAQGVKLIGATAHYVTADLDEGPIIAQEVARVEYNMHVEDLVALGRDVECMTLAHAVKWHLERRVFLDGTRTIVFRD
jgi:formyltetrahydrofolate deformylase